MTGLKGGNSGKSESKNKKRGSEAKAEKKAEQQHWRGGQYELGTEQDGRSARWNRCEKNENNGRVPSSVLIRGGDSQ